MIGGDDEQIVLPQNNLKGGKRFIAGKTQLNIFKDRSASLEECDYTVMLQLSGTGSATDETGVDIVTVLDVSGSMGEENKLTDMKTAMLFLINKLRPIDRLSIIKFSGAAERLCPLRQMTAEFKLEAEQLVENLVARGATNIHDGLEAGINVLKNRKYVESRTVGIILMSDGEQTHKDAADVELGGVPVHTFGLGQDHKPEVMEILAKKTTGGTYSTVQQDVSLCMAFSTCLAGLLTVIVEDLQLTVTPIDSTIKAMITGNYKKTISGVSQTIEFCSLYNKEIRNILVDLHLPAASKDEQEQVLKITYSYRVGGKLFESNAVTASVRRTGTLTKEMETGNEDVKIEQARIRTSEMICEANVLAGGNNLNEAQEKLDEAQDFLENEFDDPAPPMIKTLKSEVKEFMNLLGDEDTYAKQGLAFALSSLISHALQRHATRGNQELDLFATPRMKEYSKQSKEFEKNPAQRPPSADEDLKKELAADLLADVRGPLSLNIQTAIQALKVMPGILFIMFCLYRRSVANSELSIEIDLVAYTIFYMI